MIVLKKQYYSLEVIFFTLLMTTLFLDWGLQSFTFAEAESILEDYDSSTSTNAKDSLFMVSKERSESHYDDIFMMQNQQQLLKRNLIAIRTINKIQHPSIVPENALEKEGDGSSEELNELENAIVHLQQQLRFLSTENKNVFARKKLNKKYKSMKSFPKVPTARKPPTPHKINTPTPGTMQASPTPPRAPTPPTKTNSSSKRPYPKKPNSSSKQPYPKGKGGVTMPTPPTKPQQQQQTMMMKGAKNGKM